MKDFLQLAFAVFNCLNSCKQEVVILSRELAKIAEESAAVAAAEKGW